MSANFIGIAPGMTGALALLSNEGALLEVADMPTLADGTKGRSTVNAPLLASCFVPDFAGAFLSNDSKDALWDRFYTGAPQRQSGCVPRQAFRGRHGV
jgi:hypothetical protein